MNLEAHRAMRREQIERWLAADGMGVVEWCKLNRMATSTLTCQDFGHGSSRIVPFVGGVNQ